VVPQELRLASITTLEDANRFLRERYIAEFRHKFAIKPAEKGTAFRRCGRSDLDWIFSPSSLDPKRTHFPTASTTMNPLSPKPKAKRVA
jgi:hypothetical protein